MSLVALICLSVALGIATYSDWASTQEVLKLGGSERNRVVKWIVRKIGWKYKLWFDFIVAIGFMWVCTAFSVVAALWVGFILIVVQAYLAHYNGKIADKLWEKQIHG